MKSLRRIWQHPRPTIREIVDRDPGHLFYPLAAVFWAANGLYVVWGMAGPYWELMSGLQLVALYLAFGAFCGPILFFGAAYAVHGACRLAGGTGSLAEARACLAWSSVPFIPVLVVMAVIILTGPSIWVLYPGSTHDEAVAMFGTWGTVYSYYQIFRLVMIVWSIYIVTMCITEIERIPILKALIVVLLLALGAYGSVMELSWVVGFVRGMAGAIEL